MAKPAETQRIRERIQTEISGDSAEIAKRLFGEVQGGATKLSRPEFLAYVQRNWQDAGFRQKLLQQVGPKNFLEIARQALATMPLAPVVPSGPANQPVPTEPTMPAPSTPIPWGGLPNGH